MTDRDTKYKPPIVFMLIDTDNKSTKQLEIEIINRVDNAINSELSKYKDKLSEKDYKTVARKMAIERNRMIKHFIFQIINMQEINNKVREKEVETVY